MLECIDSGLGVSQFRAASAQCMRGIRHSRDSTMANCFRPLILGKGPRVWIIERIFRVLVTTVEHGVLLFRCSRTPLNAARHTPFESATRLTEILWDSVVGSTAMTRPSVWSITQTLAMSRWTCCSSAARTMVARGMQTQFNRR